MYGETALEWKPYGDKNIAELIASFQQAYPLYTLELQAFPANLELDVAEIAEWKCKKSHQLIILDINLLAIHSQVSTILDDCHVGGIIIPYFPFKDSGLNDKLDSYKNKYLPHLMLYKSLPRFGLRKEIQTNVFESELFDKIDMIASECLQVVKHTGKTSSKDFSF